MAPDIRKLLEGLEEEVKRKSCLKRNGRLSPFLNSPCELPQGKTLWHL